MSEGKKIESKKYGLSKQELDRLRYLVSLTRDKEEMINALTDRYKTYLVVEVFKRLSIEPKLFPFAKVNLNTGELVIDQPQKEKNAQDKKQAQGKKSPVSPKPQA